MFVDVTNSDNFKKTFKVCASFMARFFPTLFLTRLPTRLTD